MQKPLRLESLPLKYLAAIMIFCILIAIVSLIRPSQIPKLEEGTFRDSDSGSVITVRNGAISYGNSHAPYDLWTGKGKRFLSTKSIIGDLYVLDTTGIKKPAEIIMDNERGASTACSIRSGNVEICFRRVA
ncbi:hypothetical protein ASG11_02875 [Sphingomonas sp. Leaf357]|uniref:hypothetical protein n=1 Tax=Sphingomonas sp. Leaf357 TaxID=1736350 RepID=UPI0007010A3F|nr:hypothetical protein [Sphingomonas sp. Leaf357]KQS03332.1 hypothetical protein ASG11_02875 [Sphingomonas sp. Leaf357]